MEAPCGDPGRHGPGCQDQVPVSCHELGHNSGTGIFIAVNAADLIADISVQTAAQFTLEIFHRMGNGGMIRLLHDADMVKPVILQLFHGFHAC